MIWKEKGPPVGGGLVDIYFYFTRLGEIVGQPVGLQMNLHLSRRVGLYWFRIVTVNSD